MTFSEYMQLRERAEAVGIGDDKSLAQLLHYLQFREAATRNFQSYMNGMDSWCQNIVEEVESRIKETEKAEMKTENAALEEEFDDWKGNAEDFEPDAYISLPVDADGVPIRIGDTVYAHDGSAFRVRSITVNNAGCSVDVKLLDGPYLSKRMEPEGLSHRAPEPPDSWQRLKIKKMISE